MRQSGGGGGGNTKKLNNGSSAFMLPDQALNGLSAIQSLNPGDLRASSRLSSNLMHSPGKNLENAIQKGAGIKGVAIPPTVQQQQQVNVRDYMISHSPYGHNKLSQVQKRDRASSVIGALLHTQADSGSSTSIASNPSFSNQQNPGISLDQQSSNLKNPKAGGDLNSTQQSAINKRKIIVSKVTPAHPMPPNNNLESSELDYVTPSEDQEILQGFAQQHQIPNQRRRQTQQHQFLTPNVQGNRQQQIKTNGNQNPPKQSQNFPSQGQLRPTNEQLAPIIEINQRGGGRGSSSSPLRRYTKFVGEPNTSSNQTPSLPQMGRLGESPSPRNQEKIDVFDQQSDTGSFVQSRVMKKVPSHFNSVNNSLADETASNSQNPLNRSSLPQAKISEYQADRIKDMHQRLKQQGKPHHSLRLNATPTPQLIETDLKSIFNQSDEVSRAGSIKDDLKYIHTTTVPSRHPKGGSSIKQPGEYGLKQQLSVRPKNFEVAGRYSGGEVDLMLKRPEGQKSSQLATGRSSFEFSQKNRVAAAAASEEQEQPQYVDQDSGSFDMVNDSNGGLKPSGFSIKYQNSKWNLLVKQQQLQQPSHQRSNSEKESLGSSSPKGDTGNIAPFKKANQNTSKQESLSLPRVESSLLHQAQSLGELGLDFGNIRTQQAKGGQPKQADLPHNIVDCFSIKTRQGFIPSQMKPNQDSFISVKSLAGIDGLWMFGVCDGHGVNGHLVSDFVKKNLPRIISQQISGVVGPPPLAVKGKKNRDTSMVTKKKSGGLQDGFLPPLVKGAKLTNDAVEDSSMAEDEQSPRAAGGRNRSESAVLSNEDVISAEERERNRAFSTWFRSKGDQRDLQIRESFRQTNDRLDSTTKIDCMMSGTTVVVTLMYKNMIICANAGDSRAVMFGTIGNDQGWRPNPLSRDHKPEDADEATRVRASNGRVEQSKIMPGTSVFGIGGKQLSNLAGQHYGPKRVWLKHKQLPGLAMTRSLGDFVAKTVGVTCDPEIKVFPSITEHDKAVVIASDGIWDRIPNEEMAATLKDYHEKRDPEGAANHLVKMSVERWQRDHGMIDDITIVIIFLNTSK